MKLIEVTCFCSGPLFSYVHALKLFVFHGITKCLWDFQDCIDLGQKILYCKTAFKSLLRLQQLFFLKIDKQTPCCYLLVSLSNSESLNELNRFDPDISAAFVY